MCESALIVLIFGPDSTLSLIVCSIVTNWPDPGHGSYLTVRSPFSCWCVISMFSSVWVAFRCLLTEFALRDVDVRFPLISFLWIKANKHITKYHYGQNNGYRWLRSLTVSVLPSSSFCTMVSCAVSIFLEPSPTSVKPKVRRAEINKTGNLCTYNLNRGAFA